MHLTREQIEALEACIGPMLSYLGRLKQRMVLRGLDQGELYARVRDAHDAIHRLSVELHYLKCDPGTVARKPK